MGAMLMHMHMHMHNRIHNNNNAVHPCQSDYGTHQRILSSLGYIQYICKKKFSFYLCLKLCATYVPRCTSSHLHLQLHEKKEKKKKTGLQRLSRQDRGAGMQSTYASEQVTRASRDQALQGQEQGTEFSKGIIDIDIRFCFFLTFAADEVGVCLED